MIRAPHPALRRLFALGGAPGQVLSALNAGQAALDALSRELDALPLLSDDAVAALAAALDLSPLDAALEGRPLPPQRSEAAGGPGGAGRRAGGGPTPVPDRPRPRAAFPASGPERRAGRIRTAAKAPAGPAAAARIEALLARHAPGAGGQPFRHTPGGPTPTSRSAGLPGMPQHRAGAGASGDGRAGAAVPVHETDRHQPRHRPRSVSEPRLLAAARSVEDATGLLPRRAARAGSPEAATTPVGAVPAPPEMDAVLVEGASEVPKAEVPLAKRPEAIPAGSTERLETAQLGGLSRMARAVARLERRASRAREASAPPGGATTAGTSTLPPAWSASTPDPEAPRESVGGLRGLLRGVRRPESEDGTPARRTAPPRELFPDLLAERMPREAGPNLLAERMEDTLLSDRLAAVLRREAMSQGIDLERVD